MIIMYNYLEAIMFLESYKFTLRMEFYRFKCDLHWKHSTSYPLHYLGKPRGKQASAYEQIAAALLMGSTLTEVFHALGEQRLEGVQTDGLGVHALGQGVSQVHLVFEQQAWRRRAGRAGARRLVALRLHVRIVAVAWTGSRRVTLNKF